jgi:hypothetical protein
MLPQLLKIFRPQKENKLRESDPAVFLCFDCGIWVHAIPLTQL